jgi:hypothetical protein
MQHETSPNGEKGITLTTFEEQLLIKGILIGISHGRIPKGSFPEDERLRRVRHHRFNVISDSEDGSYTFWDNEHGDMTILLEELENERQKVIKEIEADNFADETSKANAQSYLASIEALLADTQS